jgi:hypothetical protein
MVSPAVTLPACLPAACRCLCWVVMATRHGKPQGAGGTSCSAPMAEQQHMPALDGQSALEPCLHACMLLDASMPSESADLPLLAHMLLRVPYVPIPFFNPPPV